MTAQQKYAYSSPIKLSTTVSNSITSPSRSRLDPQYAARLQRSSPNSKQRSPSRLIHRNSSSLSPGRSLDSSSAATSPYIYSDRYIPSRSTSNLENYVDAYSENCAVNCGPLDGSLNGVSGDARNDPLLRGSEPEMPPQVALPNDSVVSTLSGDVASGNSASGRNTPLSHQPLIGALLRSELFGENANTVALESSIATPQRSCHRRSHLSQSPLARGNIQNGLQKKSFRFQSPRHGTMPITSVLKTFNLNSASNSEKYMAGLSQQRKRKIAKVPFKVLDAPALEDDFYLNLVDW